MELQLKIVVSPQSLQSTKIVYMQSVIGAAIRNRGCNHAAEHIYLFLANRRGHETETQPKPLLVLRLS